MKEELVSYEIAKRLKELGFDWDTCNFIYEWEDGEVREIFHKDASNHNQVSAPDVVVYSQPTLSLAAKWLRDVKGIAINVIAHDGGEYHWSEVYLPNFKEQGYRWYDYREHPLVPTYEKALSDALDTMLTLLTESHAD